MSTTIRRCLNAPCDILLHLLTTDPTYPTPNPPQPDLETIGASASGALYKVDEDIVLKSGRIFTAPPPTAPSQDHWFYASETLFHSNLLKNEQFILRLLQRHPHPNIIDILDATHPEGTYFRRYLQRHELSLPNDHSTRLQWYRGIADALLHLHTLGIAHSDLRIDNVLFDAAGGAYMCDFSAAAPFGTPNVVFSDQPVAIRGGATRVSDATDRFALGTLMFQLEHGAKPCFSVDAEGVLLLPEVRTGHAGLDVVIRRAWVGEYASTAEMLGHLESLRIEVRRKAVERAEGPQREMLRERIRLWRESRLERFGCVLCGLPSEEHLQSLADRYGWDKDGDLRFTDYREPACDG